MSHGSGGAGPLKALDYIPTFSGADDESFAVWYNDVCNIIGTLNPRKMSPELFDIALFNKLRGEAAEIGRRVRSSILNTRPPVKCDSPSVVRDSPSIAPEVKIVKDDKGKEKEEEKDEKVKEEVKEEVLDEPFRSVFLEEFRRAFNSPAQAAKWYSKLDSTRQNNSDVVKYVHLVTNFSYRANPLASESEIIVRIICGLDDHYRSRYIVQFVRGHH